MNFSHQFLQETGTILSKINVQDIEDLALNLAQVRNQDGRLFILGVGGSAGHASHAVNDFRKICNFEAYAPTDNVSELTARVNDEGWESTFSEWLKGSRLNNKDSILVFSVGGGSPAKNISMNIVNAIDYALECNTKIFRIVGKDGGYTRSKAHASVLIPVSENDRITPHTEGLCAVIWHLLVSHPAPKMTQTKWESTK